MVRGRKLDVWLVFGTRPEAIKMAPVYEALKKSGAVEPTICLTAQHREMLDHVLMVFDITPDHDLNLMSPGQTLHGLGGKALSMLGDLFERRRPDMVLVQGDTTTTLVAALAAFYNGIPIGHVEAGLRTGKMEAPFPEEANRVLTSRLANLHFAPTERAAQALLGEGIGRSSIHVTGNTVVDALLKVMKVPFEGQLPVPDSHSEDRLILVTAHRRESFGPKMDGIFLALRRLAERDDVQIVVPLHLNPNVRSSADRYLKDRERIRVVEPMEYHPFVHLMSRSYLILTDSGGIQEEAPSLGVPVLVMREVTERPEAKDAGVAKLTGADSDSILNHANRLLDDPDEYKRMALKKNPYGDGQAGKRIADIVVEWLSSK